MTEDEHQQPRTEPRKPKKKGGGLTGESLGGMLAGFDQAVFRTTPPPHELVLKGSPVRGLSGEGGEDGDDELIITLPGYDVPSQKPPEEAGAPEDVEEP